MSGRRRQMRSHAPELNARTGEDYLDTREAFASDSASRSPDEPTEQPVVGRTAYDLLYEHGVSGAAANLIAGMDSVEVLGTAAYVLLGVFARGGGGLPRAWVFLVLLAGYHTIIKPLGDLLRSRVAVRRDRPPAGQ